MPHVVPGCVEEPPLRANGRMVHLTYAALRVGEMNFDLMLNAARRWALTRHGLLEYVIGELETPLVNDARRDAAEAEAAAADGGEGGEKKDTAPAWARMLNKANSTREGMALLAEKARARAPAAPALSRAALSLTPRSLRRARTPAEKRARREAGRDGPRGPGVAP